MKNSTEPKSTKPNKNEIRVPRVNIWCEWYQFLLSQGGKVLVSWHCLGRGAGVSPPPPPCPCEHERLLKIHRKQKENRTKRTS